MTPAAPAERVTDAARELNVATRFGRMEIAAQGADDEARADFVTRHEAWGRELRVVDVELAGLDMADGSNATVLVDVSWVLVDESVLRTTRVAQTWEDSGRGWKLVNEERVAGDAGLFGDEADRVVPTDDVHFPTKTLR